MENRNVLMLGDSLDVLRGFGDCTVDSLVTDPPAGIGFMGKDWDHDKGGRDLWVSWMRGIMDECLRVLKPGGHGLVWALPRTSHWTAMALEDAGFEIRDCVYHIFGSGFPKSLNVGKQIDKINGVEREVVGIKDLKRGSPIADQTTETSVTGWNKPDYPSVVEVTKGTSDFEGWGTGLKPAVECYWLVRKPISEKNIAENCLKWGTGGINIDGCRVETEDKINSVEGGIKRRNKINQDQGFRPYTNGFDNQDKEIWTQNNNGRFPANLIHDGSEDVVGMFPYSTSGEMNCTSQGKNYGIYGKYNPTKAVNPKSEGSAARFFYCSKSSKFERNAGLEDKKWFYNMELITEFCTFEENKIWVRQGQNQNMDFNGEAPQGKDISGDMIPEVVDNGWDTILFGKNTTEIFPLGIAFTTETGIKQTIELKTSNYYQHLTINDCIQDVIKTNQESGLNLAENVGIKNLLRLIFIKDKTGFPLGVRVVAKKTSQSISVKDAWQRNNIHSTVKPISLMRYLCRLITPKGGVVLDPFMGSGSTGCAAVLEGFRFIGIDKEEEYVRIAEARIKYWEGKVLESEEEEKNTPKQMKLF